MSLNGDGGLGVMRLAGVRKNEGWRVMVWVLAGVGDGVRWRWMEGGRGVA